MPQGAETIKLILRNLAALTQYLAEWRSLYGTGHGRDGRHKGLQPRHARLAVGLAVSFIDFVTETFRERQFAEETDSVANDVTSVMTASEQSAQCVWGLTAPALEHRVLDSMVDGATADVDSKSALDR